MFFSNVIASNEIGDSFLTKLLRVLMTNVLEFVLLIFKFCLKELANCLFSFTIFSVVFKKLSRFLIKHLFRMRFGIISYCCLALDIFLVFSIGLENIGDKEVPRYI